MGPLRLATRGSAQATAQATALGAAIRAATGREFELVIVSTTGDVRRDVPLHTIGGQGVFTAEVQLAVLDGRADAAVHSAKDLPTERPPGLTIAAIATRRDPADTLVGRSLADLAPGATVATGSVRRRAQLAALRTDLTFAELRGNIATRLERIPVDGSIMMAATSLEILGETERIAERFDPASFVPAVGQGSVAVECGADDAATIEALGAVDDRAARRAVTIERAWLAGVGGGCSLPIGGHVIGDELHVMLADRDEWPAHTAPQIYREVIALTGDLDVDCDLAAETARTALVATER